MKNKKTLLLEIQEKLDSIAKIPKLEGMGEDFKGIEITSSGIVYNSESFYTGCGTDHYSFEISWEELEKPLEYFEQKYKGELAAYHKKIEIQKQAKEEEELKKELAEYQALKRKFEE